MELNNSTNLNNSNSTDHCDMTSLEILNKCHLDLFPKKQTVCDDVNCMAIVEQLPILNGEYIQFIGPSGKLNDEILIITNFRLFLLTHNHTSFINIPIMLIEWIEIRENLYVYVYLKNAKTIRITFSSNEKANQWYQRLNAIITKLIGKVDELFAFTFYSWLTNEKLDESNENTKCLFSKNDQTNLIYKEFKRMKFDTKLWRISEANKKFELCPTYPESVIVPKCVTDDQLRKIASFRSSKRFPTVVWRSKINGAVLARSSQPNVGLLAWRLNEDELLLKSIGDCCSSSSSSSANSSNLNHHSSISSTTANSFNSTINNNTNGVNITSNSSSSTANNATNSINNISNNESGNLNGNANTNGNNSSSNLANMNKTAQSVQTTTDQFTQEQGALLLIIDARTRTVALANRVKGGGYEYSEYYTNCEIQFMNIENIHVIRSSFQSLRLLCQSINDNKLLLSQLENTKWLHHLSGILKAACTVISAIDQHAKPVLIHCSDGWDRTPQILTLAKLLLDPYYRTINGFRTLIEVDWLLYGHKFGQRNGHAANFNDINERCPVFLQWLDCIYQISKQFPSAFQFNETYLLKLCYHSYSCLFGTFLCDSVSERVNEHTDERTFSIWPYLNDKNKEIINNLYDDQYDEVLYPKYELVNMQLWQKLFCESEITYLTKVDRQEMQNLNDSIDAGLYGSSPPLYTNQLQQSSENIELDQSSNTRINSLLKNAIDTNSIILNSSNGSCSNQGRVSSSGNQINKTRSFDDISKCLQINKLDQADAKSNLSNSLSNEDMGSLESTSANVLNRNRHNSNGDPLLQMRSCSESNLLLDALQNCASTSPKLTSNGNNFNFNTKTANQNATIANEAITSQTLTADTKDKSEDGSTSTKSNDDSNKTSETNSISASQTSLNNITNENNNNNNLTSVSSLTNANLANLNNSLMQMQNSTDTIVDAKINGTNLINDNKLLAGLSIETADAKLNGNSSSAGESASESSNSSTIPSPTLSTTNLKNIQFTNGNSQATASKNVTNTNCMSTSTSGLSDYVESAKFRYLNDTIKYFEKNFNNLDLVNGINNIGEDYFYNNNNTNGNVSFIKEFGKFNLKPNGSSIIESVNLNNNSNNKLKANDRKTSNSIPIKKHWHHHEKKKEKNPNKKSIQDCIDIDGLTKIEDRSCRKIIEREENYKKEIVNLREQVTKCKWFFNKLINNPAWQDHYQHEYVHNENLIDNSQSEENQSNSYSFSNDSICSSWDEIDESDYKLATWVPDYIITHCQSCNEKFSYSLRKHHCRNCGQVFCYKCADQFYPLPNHNLTAPVRVCHSCKLLIEKQGSTKSQLNNFNSKASNLKLNGNNSNNNNNNSSTLIFSSTPPNFSADLFQINKNEKQPNKLINPVNKAPFSPFSTSPTPTQYPMPATYPTTSFAHNSNSKQSSSACNTNNGLNLGIRCNRLDSDKFNKKNGNPKSQKVSV